MRIAGVLLLLVVLTVACGGGADGGSPREGTPPVSPLTITPTPATVKIGSESVAPDGSVAVAVEALNISGAGLGAVTVDVQYNAAMVDATACIPDPGGKLDTKLCNTDFATNVVRLTAIRAACGVTGNVGLAELTFKALGQVGQVSPLDVTVVTFADCNGDAISVSGEDGSITIATPTTAAATATMTRVSGSGGHAVLPVG